MSPTPFIRPLPATQRIDPYVKMFSDAVAMLLATDADDHCLLPVNQGIDESVPPSSPSEGQVTDNAESNTGVLTNLNHKDLDASFETVEEESIYNHDFIESSHPSLNRNTETSLVSGPNLSYWGPEDWLRHPSSYCKYMNRYLDMPFEFEVDSGTSLQSLGPSYGGMSVTGVSQNEPSSSDNVPRNRPARHGRRGTRMMGVTLSRTSGSRLEIQFNEKLQPVGPNKRKYNSFIGYLARSKVSILTDEWKKVDFDTVKQPIWDIIQLTYTIPDSEELKDKTLSYCADRWRKFKTSLANTYIFVEVPPAKHPWEQYTFIDE